MSMMPFPTLHTVEEAALDSTQMQHLTDKKKFGKGFIFTIKRNLQFKQNAKVAPQNITNVKETTKICQSCTKAP